MWSLLCYIYIGCVQRMPAVSISIWPCTCNRVQSSALNSAGAIPWRRPGGKQFVHTLCDRIKGCERMKYGAEPRIWNWCRGGKQRKIRHLLLQSNSTPSPWEKHIGLQYIAIILGQYLIAMYCNIEHDIIGEPKRMYIENNCFTIWYADASEKAWGDAGRGILPTTNQVWFDEVSQRNGNSSDRAHGVKIFWWFQHRICSTMNNK